MTTPSPHVPTVPREPAPVDLAARILREQLGAGADYCKGSSILADRARALERAR